MNDKVVGSVHVRIIAFSASTLYQQLRTAIPPDDPRRALADQAMAKIAQAMEAAGMKWDGIGWQGSSKQAQSEVAFTLPEDQVAVAQELLASIYADPKKTVLQRILRTTDEQLDLKP